MMKKKFKMQDIDCANCAAKMEDAIKKIPGVIDAKLSFITQKLTLECEPEDLDRILEDAQKAISKIEPDAKIMLR